MAQKVKFVRIRVTGAGEVTKQLQVLADQGWQVISHADDGDGEYSFVLRGHLLETPQDVGA